MFRFLCLAICASAAAAFNSATLTPTPRHRGFNAVPTDSRALPVHMMGRKFENNKLKMAKTALACALSHTLISARW